MYLTRTALLAAIDTVVLPSTGKGLVASGAVPLATVCDGLIAVKLSELHFQGVDGAGRNTLVQQLREVIHTVAQRAGVQVQQCNIEFGAPTKSGGSSASQPSAPTARTTHGTPAPTAPAANGSQAATGRTVPLASAQVQGRPMAAQAGPAAKGSVQDNAQLLPNVRHIIAVGAGKGGVGKSTVAVNLAVGLALRGHAVGLLDGDIYGPSLPTMLGLDGLSATALGPMLQPFYVHGIKAMTIGKLVDPEKPLIFRGPMAQSAFKQLTDQTEWGELDYLIIDLPPGTGDIVLTMCQMLKLTGAVLVCTPQQVAQDDAVRALRMFQQLSVEVLGIVENMSYFIADDIPASQGGPREYDIFGKGGAQQMAQRLGAPFLGSLPITIKLRQNSDGGNPSANFQASTPLAEALDKLVQNLEGQVALASLKTSAGGPKLTIS